VARLFIGRQTVVHGSLPSDRNRQSSNGRP
jgi:hypothetical protein